MTDTQAQTYNLWWNSPDLQGGYDMGTYDTYGEAERAVPAALAELLDQCGEDEQREVIRQGSWSINGKTVGEG